MVSACTQLTMRPNMPAASVAESLVALPPRPALSWKAPNTLSLSTAFMLAAPANILHKHHVW